MSEITWNDLTKDEQDAVLLFREHNCVGEPTDEATRLAHSGLIKKGVIAKNSDAGYIFTPAGRALLPAGEAVDESEARNGVLFGKYQAYLEDMESLDLSDNAMNYQRWLEVEVIERDESNKMELTTLTASWESLNNRLTDELAAALARAQAAEGEAARLRMVLSLNPIHDKALLLHETYQGFDGQCPYCRCDSDEPHKDVCPVFSLSSYVDSLK